MTGRSVARALAAAVVCIALASGTAQAMGSGSKKDTVAEVDPDYTAAQANIQEEDFDAAVALLTKVVDRSPEDANAQNLLGFSYRRLGEFDSAIVHYNAALEIDPKHKDAHEYIGEAYLELGDLENAEMHLEALDKICVFGCAAYRELKRAIKTYRQNLAS